jgi:hypothetical protein
MTPPKAALQSRPAKAPQRASVIPLRGRPITIVTKKLLPASASLIWDSLMFYEQIEKKPPLLLRILLPYPVRTEGEKEAVGDVATCVYAQGHLLKQLLQTVHGELYEFQVIEQHLRIGGSLRLMGGSYKLQEISAHQTEVSVTTRYLSRKWPRAFWRPVEGAVCHAFHRYLLAAIQSKAMASSETTGSSPRSVPRRPE